MADAQNGKGEKEAFVDFGSSHFGLGQVEETLSNDNLLCVLVVDQGLF